VERTECLELPPFLYKLAILANKLFYRQPGFYIGDGIHGGAMDYKAFIKVFPTPSIDIVPE